MTETRSAANYVLTMEQKLQDNPGISFSFEEEMTRASLETYHSAMEHLFVRASILAGGFGLLILIPGTVAFALTSLQFFGVLPLPETPEANSYIGWTFLSELITIAISIPGILAFFQRKRRNRSWLILSGILFGSFLFLFPLTVQAPILMNLLPILTGLSGTWILAAGVRYRSAHE